MRSRSVAASVTLVLFAFAGASSQAALQLLQNGGFEAGTSAWSGQAISTSGCPAASGSAALALAPTAAQQAVALQRVAGVGGGAGPYALMGVARAGSSAPTATAYLRFLDGSDTILAQYPVSLPLGASYAAFGALASAAPPGSVTAEVRIVATGSGTACVDDLSLDGPAPATATPSLTPTPPPTPTPLPTATPTRTPTQPSASSTRAPTNTPRPPAATSTPRPPSSGGSSGAGGGGGSLPAIIPTEGLLNGGLESGITPWQKFGGELGVVSSPTNSGSGAASFTSATTSTKWAYQVVRVSGGGVYEFSGFLQPGTGVSESYLRVSWYGSADGSGSAIGNSDSTTRLAGATGAFTRLATGPVQAPASAASARVRVMLAPASAAPAVLYFDDMAFGPAEASAATPAPVSAPTTLEEDLQPDSPADTQASRAPGAPTAAAEALL
ncbi:MAG TPA: hypothetical protein VNO23_08430, partial [Candidatus Binatia bacterium]|nr:hypothetical protein [Candidatus Binatia bacterium]